MPFDAWRVVESVDVSPHPKWARVTRDTVELPNGLVVPDYFLTHWPHAALIVAFTPENEVVLVRQYKHGAGKMILELPGGLVEPDQDLEAAARAELMQEVGLEALSLIHLISGFYNSTKSPSISHGFLAVDTLEVGGQNLDATEAIEIVRVPPNQILPMILQRRFETLDTQSFLLTALVAHPELFA